MNNEELTTQDPEEVSGSRESKVNGGIKMADREKEKKVNKRLKRLEETAELVEEMKEQFNEKFDDISHFDGRIAEIEEFFKSVYGGEPEVLNLHFVIESFRVSQEQAKHVQARSAVIEQFIVETEKQEEFDKWQAEKRSTQQEQMKQMIADQQKAKGVGVGAEAGADVLAKAKADRLKELEQVDDPDRGEKEALAAEEERKEGSEGDDETG